MARKRRKIAVGALAALLLLGLAAWWFRGPIARLVGGAPEPVAVSPQAAASAQAKVEEVRAGGEAAQLSAVEITSLIRYRAPSRMLQIVREPTVQLAGDTVRLTGMVPTDRLPEHPDLDRVRMLLPDTARLVVRGTLRPLAAGKAALDVRSVEFAGIPIPARYYPAILERMGRGDAPGLAPASVGLTLPAGVGSARVEGGYLVLSPATH